ncbi:MAG: hypothetical protein ACRDT4_02485 [Micromonosporaceae bacterium]
MEITLPSRSRTAAREVMSVGRLAVRDQVPVAGSYRSVGPYSAASTVPSASRVAVNSDRAVVIAPVGDHWPVAGSYSSAEAIGGQV